ncbi:hypothetical protein ILYODFUR_023671 [Ilyodon furcidens]|uniref:Uncharacterized protein n=1 Tax=Ilyodon furcidens TaxID=33524 RepID=A0ABV0TL32_9TELE
MLHPTGILVILWISNPHPSLKCVRQSPVSSAGPRLKTSLCLWLLRVMHAELSWSCHSGHEELFSAARNPHLIVSSPETNTLLTSDPDLWPLCVCLCSLQSQSENEPHTEKLEAPQ